MMDSVSGVSEEVFILGVWRLLSRLIFDIDDDEINFVYIYILENYLRIALT